MRLQHFQLSRVLYRVHAHTSISLADDADVLERLSRGMDEIYVSIDTTFRNIKMHEVPRPGRLTSAWGIHPGEWRVDLRIVHIVPFDAKLVERAAWRSEGAESGSNVRIWGYWFCPRLVADMDVVGQENVIRKSSRYSYSHPIGDLMIHQRSVTRRYRERDRTILISKAYTQPIPGVTVLSTRQMIIRRGEPTVTGPTTVIETYVIGTGSASSEAQTVAAENPLLGNRFTTRPEDDTFSVKMWELSMAKTEDSMRRCSCWV